MLPGEKFYEPDFNDSQIMKVGDSSFAKLCNGYGQWCTCPLKVIGKQSFSKVGKQSFSKALAWTINQQVLL